MVAESPDQSLWTGRRVLLTGHTGFKGSWLSMWLHRMRAELVGFSNGVPTQPSLYEAAGVDGVIDSVFGDVRDLDSLSRTVGAAAPSVVFHLAAQPLVLDSFEDPIGTFETNVLGTANVLEAVRRSEAPVDAVVVVTTDKCYENRGWDHGYRETDRLGGRDPYSASKAAAEHVANAYRFSLLGDSVRCGLVTVRAGNVIGGGDYARDRLIPDIVRASETPGGRVTLRNPTAERPWQHVLDCLSGYLLLVERLLDDHELAGAWNFGPVVGSSANVGDVVDEFVKRLGRNVPIDVQPVSEKHEEMLLALDSSRARRRLGWTPRLGLRDAIGLTADWYASQADGSDAREVSMQQISEYERLGAAPADASGAT